LNRVGTARSFTHLIAYALTKAVAKVPAMNSGFGLQDGKPVVVHHDHLNLGIAVDVERPDGTRSLLVPNIKHADELDFATFFSAYEELIRKVRTNKLARGLAGTWPPSPARMTDGPSVPRLCPDRASSVSARSLPGRVRGADPQTIARLAVSKVFTLTSTYDHRIIGGAESGEYLRAMHQLLQGNEGFYDEIFRSFDVPYEPARWSTDVSPLDDETTAYEKVVNVHQLVNMYRVRGHLIANLDPLGRREPRTHPELDVNHYGLTIWDLDREFPVGELGSGSLSLRRSSARHPRRAARRVRTIGVEYMHIQEPEQKEGSAGRAAHPLVRAAAPDPRLPQRAGMRRRFITPSTWAKRFSLEGAESLIPMLDVAQRRGGLGHGGARDAHRGRLNVLVEHDRQELRPDLPRVRCARPGVGAGFGRREVPRRLGGTHTAAPGHKIVSTLASEPEPPRAVDPVVEGMARQGDRRGDTESRSAGAPRCLYTATRRSPARRRRETLNLSEVPARVAAPCTPVVNNRAHSRPHRISAVERVRDGRRQMVQSADLPRER
jgi:2-oxoglutarate dehydrogenase E1 component